MPASSSGPRPLRSPARLRALAATTSLIAGLLIAPMAGSAPAVASSTDPEPLASTVGQKLLTVTFDAQSATIDRGRDFTVSGTISKVTQDGVLGEPGKGVPASFTLAVTDAEGAVLGTQDITAAADGTFSTTVPGSVTAVLPRNSGPVSLAVRALDATFSGGYASANAGAAELDVRTTAKRLRLTNSFVSSVGWVKPGDRYPSRVILTNPTSHVVKGAKVVVTAPKGTRFLSVSGKGRHAKHSSRIVWRPGKLAAGATETLVLMNKAATLRQLPTLVWRDLSTTAVLSSKVGSGTAVSHGPKVIPPSSNYDTARYGDRPFAVIPVEYADRSYVSGHSGGDLEAVINDRSVEGSTFNLYQEMSLKQLFPNGDVPSAGIASRGWDYKPGFTFQTTDPSAVSTCTGATFADSPVPAEGSPLYPERITNGVYNLPGTTQWYGQDGNGSAIVGAETGVATFMQIDSGCGPTGKLVADAVTLADPEIDFSDFDTDKDGVVDFLMVVFAGCGGNGGSQLGAAGAVALDTCPLNASDAAPYDNVWPHSSSLEYYYSDPASGLAGFTTHDQLKDLEGRKLYYTSKARTKMTTRKTPWKVFVRVGPYNVNPETAIDAASVISHEYGHSLGLPDFYSLGSRSTYGDWNLMATDKSQNMDAFSRQELGWVVPQPLTKNTTVKHWKDSKQNTGVIHWKTRHGKRYTLKNGRDGRVRNSEMYVAKLPGRKLISKGQFKLGEGASASHAWFSGSGNDFGCMDQGGGHNIDLFLPALSKVAAGTDVTVSFKSMFDIEWDYDYGFVMTSTDGRSFTSHASTAATATTTTTNPNQNACQGKYSNGITGSSASYTDPITVATDRAQSAYPASVWMTDSFDVSDLAGAKTPVLRFSYATDPGLARPGWFIDDVVVKAGDKVIWQSNFEKTGSPQDAHVFNGGCKDTSLGGACTHGWQYVKAGAPADFDHAYYLEMRDRSGFDLDGNGQIDRSPIGWQPGLYVGYTDEAHGYGNVGTDDPPAQSPIDAVPSPGDETPDLNDAAFQAVDGRDTFTDFGKGHTDNYTNPAENRVDDRYPSESNPWRFTYGCLMFKVLSMSGQENGPEQSNGDLTGTVRFRIGPGCGTFDYGYGR